MESLDFTDVERLIKLLADAGDPTVEIPIPERKRMLIVGLAEIIGADIWIWSTGVAKTPNAPEDAMATSWMDGGWESEEQRLRFVGLLTDPKHTELLQTGILRKIYEKRVVTVGPEGHVHPERQEEALALWKMMGLGDCLVAIYPLGPVSFSGLGFHRRQHRPDFTERERAIVQLVVEQVDWLHRYGSNIPADQKIMRLSGRQRQVLLLLLAGDSQRQIALKIQLSEHTVNDHVKEIYRRFDVNSRGELFAHFVSGGKLA